MNLSEKGMTLSEEGMTLSEEKADPHYEINSANAINIPSELKSDIIPSHVSCMYCQDESLLY